MGQEGKPWFVYLVRCSDGSLYTGVAKDVQARVDNHNRGRGATYTAQRRPVTLIYQEYHPDHRSALQRELQIKHWRRCQKEALAEQRPVSQTPRTAESKVSSTIRLIALPTK